MVSILTASVCTDIRIEFTMRASGDGKDDDAGDEEADACKKHLASGIFAASSRRQSRKASAIRVADCLCE